jgi:hypothetical protein
MVLLPARTTSSEAGLPFSLDSEVVRGPIEASQPLPCWGGPVRLALNGRDFDVVMAEDFPLA